jgi:multidrug resistance protein, MATE family
MDTSAAAAAALTRRGPDRLSLRARGHGEAIARLAGPLLINNLAMAGMATADTVMAGQLSAMDLAAVALGANFFYILYVMGLGLLMSLTPTIAQAYGAGRDAEIGGYFRQGLWLAAGVSVLVVAGLSFVRPVLTLMGAEPPVVDLATRYVHAVMFGAPAIMLFLALRFAGDGIGWTRPVIYTAVIALVVNIAGNYVFMYGKLGMPALGAVGCGVATALTQWLILAVLAGYVASHRAYRRFAPFARFEGPDFNRLRELLRLGVPISGSLIAEVSLFSLAALILGALGATVVAAHAIAINYATLAFMIPMSFAAATTIHVGHRIGAGDLRDARLAGWTGTAMGVGVMVCSALFILLANDWVAGLYTRDAVVAALAASLLVYAGVFQVADGMQVGMAAALRGFKDAAVPMVICVGAYWLIGFALAWYLGFTRGQGAPGVWIGLTVGLFAAAAMLTVRFRVVSRRSLTAGDVTA